MKKLIIYFIYILYNREIKRKKNTGGINETE